MAGNSPGKCRYTDGKFRNVPCKCVGTLLGSVGTLPESVYCQFYQNNHVINWSTKLLLHDLILTTALNWRCCWNTVSNQYSVANCFHYNYLCISLVQPSWLTFRRNKYKQLRAPVVTIFICTSPGPPHLFKTSCTTMSNIVITF